MAVEVTPDDVRDIAKELAALTDATIQRYIDQAKLRVHADTFGGLANLAVAYLSAHLCFRMEKTGASGPAGPVVSESAGRLSRSYAAPATGMSDLMATKWGQEFVALRKTLGASIIVV